MDEKEYQRKFLNLKILKGIQDYLKSAEDSDAALDSDSAVYPIKVPQELLYQLVKLQGAEGADEAIHRIFRLGLTFWSERLFEESFGTAESLKIFIELVKSRNKD